MNTDLKEIGRLLGFLRRARNDNTLPQSLRNRATETLKMLRAEPADITQLINLVRNNSAPIGRRERAMDILINIAIAGV